MAQVIQNWSAKTYNRHPNMHIESLSVNPAKIKVTMTVDQKAGIVGTGEGSTKKIAEKLAVESLYQKILPLMEKCTMEPCPITDPQSYKTFFTEDDQQQPWFATVKTYVNSISIMYTRQPSKLVEVVEWGKKYWVTMAIEADPYIYGRGVATSKKEAVKLAAAVIAKNLDEQMAKGPSSEKPPLQPVPLKDYEDYLVKEPESMAEHQWLKDAKGQVNRAFTKFLKREPSFDVTPITTVSPTRYLAKVEYDAGFIGKGQGLTSKEAIRLACIDLCMKFRMDRPDLLFIPELEKKQQPSITHSSPSVVPPSSPAIKPKENQDDSSEPLWKKKPKMVIHEIFVKEIGRTPTYTYSEDKDKGCCTAYVRMDYNSREFLCGRGVGATQQLASFNAAFDFCRRYYSNSSSSSIGEKRFSDDERAPGTKPLKQPKNPKVFDEPLKPLSPMCSFVSWVFRHYNKPDNVQLAPLGPAHMLNWSARLQLWIDSVAIEGQGEDKSKKHAIIQAVDQFVERLNRFDPELMTRYESRNVKKFHVLKESPAEPAKQQEPSKVVEDSAVTNSIIKIPASVPEVPLLMSVNDRKMLEDFCAKKSIIECIDGFCKKHEGPVSVASPTKDNIPPSVLFLQEKSAIMTTRHLGILEDRINEDEVLRDSRTEILQALNLSNVIILSGSLWTGKSPNISSLILDSMITNGNGVSCNVLVLVSTEIEAMCLAKRTAVMRKVELGEEVGFKTGLGEDVEPEMHGSILFITFSQFLNLLSTDQDASFYSHILVSDTSTRSLDCDLALCACRQVLIRRPELRLMMISGSNTRPLEEYYSYFSKTVVRRDLQDQAMPKVDVQPAVESDGSLRMDLVLKNYLTVGETIILLVPNYSDALTVKQSLAFGIVAQQKGVSIFIVHSKMTMNDFERAQEPCPPNVCKILICTDVAETGIINAGQVVIDCGRRIGPHSDDLYGVQSDPQYQDSVFFPEYLQIVDAESQLKRSVLAEREYVLLQHGSPSKDTGTSDALRLSPERLITQTIAKTKGNWFGLSGVIELLSRLPERRDQHEIERTFNKLVTGSVITNSGHLTSFGSILVRIPLPLDWARFLIGSLVLRCMDVGVLIAACGLLKEMPFSMLSDDPMRFSEIRSDHISAVLAFQEWRDSRAKFISRNMEVQFCEKNGFSLSTLLKMEKLRNRLMDCLDKELGLAPAVAAWLEPANPAVSTVLNANSTRKSICRGLLLLALGSDKLAISRESPLLTLQNTPDTMIHVPRRSSCNRAEYDTDTGPGVFVYDYDANSSIYCVSRVPAIAAVLHCPVDFGAGGELGLRAGWIEFNHRDARLLHVFNHILHNCMFYIVTSAFQFSKQSVSDMAGTDEYARQVIDLAGSMIKYQSMVEN